MNGDEAGSTRKLRDFHQVIPPPGVHEATIIPSEETLEERAAFRPFIGREAIYYETTPHIVHVKIAQIKFGRHIDRTVRCIKIEMEGLRTHGLRFKEQICLVADLDCVSGFDFAHCYPSCWYYERAYLFFSQIIINDVVNIVSNLPAGKTFLHDYIAGSYVPGETAAAVLGYVQKARREEMYAQIGQQPIIPVRRIE